MSKKNRTRSAVDEALDADALAFLKPLLRKATGKPTSRAEDKRIRQGVRALPSPLLERVAERIYVLSSLRFEAASEATRLGMEGPWRDLISEASGTVSTIFFTINSELEDRAAAAINDLMPDVVKALEDNDPKALAAASLIYRALPGSTRRWWRDWNYGRLDAPNDDRPGWDFDFEPIEYVDGARELRRAVNRRRKRRERAG